MAQLTVDGLITPDFSSTKDRLSEGSYKVRIVNSEVKQWPAKEGNPPTTYIAWKLETFGEEVSKNNGRVIFHNTAIEGGGAFRLQDLYVAATGMECPSPFDRTLLHSCEVQIVYGPQKNRPEFNEVKSVKPIKH